jgi:hypothetical protein
MGRGLGKLMSGRDVDKSSAEMLLAFQAKRTRVIPGFASLLKGTRIESSGQRQPTDTPARLKVGPDTSDTRILLPSRTPAYRPRRKPRAIEPLDFADLKKNANARAPRRVQQEFRETIRQAEAVPSLAPHLSPVSSGQPVGLTAERPSQPPVEIDRPQRTAAARFPAPLTGSVMMRLGLFLGDVALVLLGGFLIWGAPKPVGGSAITVSLVLVISGAWLGLWALLFEPEDGVCKGGAVRHGFEP